MPLKVLNVGQNYFVRGGSDKYQFQLEKLLTRRGHATIPFASSQSANRPSTWADYFPKSVDFDHPGPADLVRFVYSPAARDCVKRLLDDAKPDLAHLHIYYGQLTSSILRPIMEAGIPIVQTLHEYKLVCPVYSLVSRDRVCEACSGGRFWNALPRRCNRGSLPRTALSVVESYVSRLLGSVSAVDRFIAVSHFQRAKIVEMGVPADKVTTIHHFVDCAGTMPATGDGEHVLYFGRLERLKGIFTLLDAVTPLADVPVLFVGDGGARDELEREIRRRGLTHVRLLGFRTGDELTALVRASIATVLPSLWYEPFGLTVIETFAEGRPVIGSRIGGISELIDDGVDGYLVPPGDVDALRERIDALARDRGRAVAMGRAGRDKVERDFTPELHYRRLMDVYRAVGVDV